MMAPAHIGTRIDREGRRREDPMPGPTFAGARILERKRIGQADAGTLLSAIACPQLTRGGELVAQRLLERSRQHDDTIAATLTVAHDDYLAIEINVLHAQLQTFEQPQA